jgi:hypothetical protein
VQPVADTFETEYFPLEKGMVRLYSVKQIVIDAEVNTFDTSEYLLKEVIDTFFINATSDTVYTIREYVKGNDENTWVFYKNCFAWIRDDKAFWQEDNLTYYKLHFPITQGAVWDENLYNRLDTSKYFENTVLSIDEAYAVNGVEFKETAYIESRNESSLIDKWFYFERYARGVGLIEKQNLWIDSQGENIDYSIPIEQRVTKGVILYQTLLD